MPPRVKAPAPGDLLRLRSAVAGLGDKGDYLPADIELTSFIKANIANGLIEVVNGETPADDSGS